MKLRILSNINSGQFVAGDVADFTEDQAVSLIEAGAAEKFEETANEASTPAPAPVVAPITPVAAAPIVPPTPVQETALPPAGAYQFPQPPVDPMAGQIARDPQIQ